MIRSEDDDADRVAKAQEWCRETLGPHENNVTWSKRLAETYESLDEDDCAIENYKQVSTPLIHCVL